MSDSNLIPKQEVGDQNLIEKQVMYPGSSIEDVKGNVLMYADPNSGDIYSGVTVYTETVRVEQFADLGAAVGTYSLKTTIPAGSVVLRSSIVSLTGFTGDVSATLTIGDGTTVDRYNTGTPNVFVTASAGVDMGAVSGTAWHTATITPLLTVTTNANFTACKTANAGSVKVTIVFIRPL